MPSQDERAAYAADRLWQDAVSSPHGILLVFDTLYELRRARGQLYRARYRILKLDPEHVSAFYSCVYREDVSANGYRIHCLLIVKRKSKSCGVILQRVRHMAPEEHPGPIRARGRAKPGLLWNLPVNQER